MNMSNDMKPITYMKTKSSDLIKEVNINRKPVFITQNGVPKAVVIDIESYEKQKDLLMLLKIVAQGNEAIKQNKLIKQDKLFKELENKFQKK